MTVYPNLMFGRNGRIWTCDPYTPSVVRYQTALRPEWLTILRKIMYIARAIYFSQNLQSYFTYKQSAEPTTSPA